MDRVAAARPFSSAVLGTLREKHNTVLQLVTALLASQAAGPETSSQRLMQEGSRDDDIRCHPQPHIKVSDVETDVKNPLVLTVDQRNAVTENLFIGSFYVGPSLTENEASDSTKLGNSDKDKEWRIRL